MTVRYSDEACCDRLDFQAKEELEDDNFWNGGRKDIFLIEKNVRSW